MFSEINTPLIKGSKFLLILLFFSACGTFKEPFINYEYTEQAMPELPSNGLANTLYLIGDAGNVDSPEAENYAALKALQKELEAENEKASVIFLGDNIAPEGLPKKSKNKREQAEKRIDNQLAVLDNFPGKAYFIPGDKDWKKEEKHGVQAIKRLENYIQKYPNKKIRFLPNQACGDPEKVKLEGGMVLLFLDTAWWLRNWDGDKKVNDGCEVKSRTNFLEQLEELMLNNKNKQIVLLMHHPMMSNGNYGGNFSARQHLFPLTDLNKALYLPIPILGSLYPIQRSTGGGHQDIAHPRYQELIKGIETILKIHSNVIVASAHENSLQYFGKKNHYIISGAGSKTTYAEGGNGADFVYSSLGYSKIYHYQNGEVWMEMIATKKNQKEILYRQQLVPARAGTEKKVTVYAEIEEKKDTVRMAPNTVYAGGGMKHFLWGNYNRPLWLTEVSAPVIDLTKTQNGLFPIKKGGGMSSNSLRLSNEDGKQFILRSVKKDFTKFLPEELRQIKMVGIITDQVSANNPFGAMAIPHLSKAAGIYYTQPELVYLSHQPALGVYNDLFPQELYYLEERPAGNRSELDNFGNSEEIIGYIELTAKMRANHKHYIDQEWVCKSRLFDMFLQDWDRHDDQWRWASFKDADGDRTMYRPIPRDRDEVFYGFDGIVPGVLKEFWARQLKPFQHDIKDVKALGLHARHFDRFFINELDKKEWKAVAEKLMNDITEKDIREAIAMWPKEVYEKRGAITIEKLIARKTNFVQHALDYYDFIAKEVNVLGTDEKERFIAKYNDKGNLEVKVYHLSKKGKQKDLLYQREFVPGETKEVRLYGFNGKDEFNIEGTASKGIKIRIIGGDGKDQVVDQSKVGGLGKKTLVYDLKEGIKIKGGPETANKTADNIEVNEYVRKYFHYNTFFPSLSLGYTNQTGLWFGAGFTHQTEGFRKHPYKALHKLSLNVFPSERNGFFVDYTGDFIKSIGKLDLFVDAFYHQPIYINHYGSGNQTIIARPDRDDQDYYWVRMGRAKIQTMLKTNFNANRGQIRFGPSYRRYTLRRDDNENTFVKDTGLIVFNEEDESFEEERQYLGGVIEIEMNTTKSKVFPKKGNKFLISTQYHNDIENDDQEYYTLDVSTSSYFTFGNKIQTTLAGKIGAGAIWGDNVPFYLQATLGNNKHLRGYRNDRFSGQSYLYGNFDIRPRFGFSNNKFLPFSWGPLLGYDIAKLNFTDSEHFTHDWRQSYTTGAWFNFVDFFVLSPFVSFGEEEETINVLFGFRF